MIPTPKKVYKYYIGYDEKGKKCEKVDEIEFEQPESMTGALSVNQVDDCVEITYRNRERIEYVMHDRKEATVAAKILAREMIDALKAEMPS